MIPTKLRRQNPVAADNSRRSKRRKKNPSPPETSDAEEDEVPESIEFLNLMKSFFATPCKVHKITRLHNIRGVNNFTRMERKLTMALYENSKYQVNKDDWDYKVELRKFTHVKSCTHDNDGDTLYICASRKSRFADEGDGWKILLRCLITCRESSKKFRRSAQGSYSPVLLISGPDVVFNTLKSSLEDIFTCYIVPILDLPAASIKLMFGRWLLYLYGQDHVTSSKAPIVIEFSHHTGEKLIQYEGCIPYAYFEDVIKSLDENPIANQVVSMWFDVLQELECPIPANIHTAISKIKFPFMRIARNGVIRVKLFTEESLFELLSSLTWLIENGSSDSSNKYSLQNPEQLDNR